MNKQTKKPNMPLLIKCVCAAGAAIFAPMALIGQPPLVAAFGVTASNFLFCALAAKSALQRHPQDTTVNHFARMTRATVIGSVALTAVSLATYWTMYNMIAERANKEAISLYTPRKPIESLAVRHMKLG
jgi:hypothetical protein